MTQALNRNRGFAAAERESCEHGTWTVGRLRDRLVGEQRAAFCRGFLAYFLRRGAITEQDFSRIMEEVTPLRASRDQEWAALYMPRSWQEWMWAKPLRQPWSTKQSVQATRPIGMGSCPTGAHDRWLVPRRQAVSAVRGGNANGR